MASVNQVKRWGAIGSDLRNNYRIVILMLHLKVENLINLLIDLLGFRRVHKNITIMGR
jgi:hypothetical protein